MSMIGRMISASEPEKWILEFIEKWQFEYLSEYEYQNGFEPHYFEPIKHFVRRNDYAMLPDDAGPALLCVATGATEPEVSDGKMNGLWTYGLLIQGGANTPENTDDLVKAHAAWMRTLFAQRPSLDREEVMDTTYVGERYDQVRVRDVRTAQAVVILLEVEVEGISDVFGGLPNDPRDDPYGDGSVEPHVVEDYDVEIHNKEIN